MRRAVVLATLHLGIVVLLGCEGPGRSPAASTTATGLPGTGAPATAQPVTEGRLRYVALGDSYTIGTSVPEADRWPDRLVAQVPGLELVANLAVNGFTSRDVVDVELPRLPALRPDFVTLLIGVNDVVQGVPPESYRQNLRRILDELVDLVGAQRVVLVTTPDYTVTPSGGEYGDPATQAAGIRANNAIALELARTHGIAVVDVYEVSLEAATDRSLVAGDGLHPSGAQYARWVALIAPVVEALLGEARH